MELDGVYVPLVTPFEGGGGVDYPALERLAGDLLDGGAAGLVALGTTAEPESLTAAEKSGVVGTVAGVCRDRRAPLIVGAHSPEELAEAAAAGADAALTLVPPFVRPGEAGVVAYFEMLAAATALPIVAYHVPYRTGQPLSANGLRAIAAIDGVIGMKLATGQIDGVTVEFLGDLPPGFSVLAGDDELLVPLLALGARGAIQASAHLATAAFAELVAAWRDRVRSDDLGLRLAALSRALFAAPNPSILKAVLHAQGRIASPMVRLPILAPPDPLVRAALISAKRVTPARPAARRVAPVGAV
jgi:4-hydroxy-tetrahydrodipicolinate synthase